MYPGPALAYVLHSLPAPRILYGPMPAAWAAFWYLALAHWLADFPLQTDWMAQHKTNIWVLLLHALIHFVVSLAVLYPVTVLAWPFLLAVAAAHFVIDATKNWLSARRPAWGGWTYLGDQLLHMLSLALVAAWISATVGNVPAAIPVGAAIVASGLVWITSVWGITEKVLWGRLRSAAKVGLAGSWQRLALRIGLYAVVLLARQAFIPAAFVLPLGTSYSASPAGKRAFWTDILVSLVASGIVSLALSR